MLCKCINTDTVPKSSILPVCIFQVFQTVVGILTKDMIQAIPGCVSVYFSELQKEENIQYINSDDWCLLQGDWKSLSNIHKRLKVFLKNGSSASGVVGPGGDANAESDFYEEISTKVCLPKISSDKIVPVIPSQILFSHVACTRCI